MEEIIQKIYKCEHCGRKMFGKGAMSRHEKYCSMSPINQHKCFQFCKYLKKDYKDIGESMDGPDYRITIFTCEKKGINLYSYKFEKCLAFKQSWVEGLTRMPLDCHLSEEIDELDI